ncbi:MAG: hypothetical protein WBA13_08005 [Microcoleaceae cyanobacterium]
MKPRQKNDSQFNNFFTKKQQPRRWMLAMMLTGVIIFKAYPTLIQTFLKETYSSIATSLTQAKETETAFNILTKNTSKVESAITTQATSDCIAALDCLPVQQGLETPLPSLMSVPNVLLSERMALNFQLMGFDSDIAQFQSIQANVSLPSQVVAAIRQNLSGQLETPPKQLNIMQATPRNWPDTCLGLAASGEFCGQQVISGWRVVVTAEDKTWIYRSDATGKLLRLESQKPTSQAISPVVVDAVFQQATEESGQPQSAFQIIDVRPNIWPDSCLGLAQPDDVCTQVLVPGWQITLSSGRTQQVYRTNQGGSQVQLDMAASSKRSRQPLLVYRFGDDSLFSRTTQRSIWNRNN